MVTYKAMFKFVGNEVHAEVLDFPGVIACAATLEEARRLLGSALSDMAEIAMTSSEALLLLNSKLTDAAADLEEPVLLVVKKPFRSKQYNSAHEFAV